MVCAMTSIDEPAASDVGLPSAPASTLESAVSQDSGDANPTTAAHLSNLETEEPHSNGTNKGLKRSRGDTTVKTVTDNSDPPLGKRVRKPNTLLADYEQQKKHEKTIKANALNSSSSSIKDISLRASGDAMQPVENEQTSQLSPESIAAANAAAAAIEAAKGAREVIMTPAQAQERNKKMPKGYAYVPEVLVQVEAPPPETLPKKRERKKVNYADYQQLKGRKSSTGDGESVNSISPLPPAGPALVAVSPSPSPSTKRSKTSREDIPNTTVQSSESKAKETAKKNAQQRKKELQDKLNQLDSQLFQLNEMEKEMEKSQQSQPAPPVGADVSSPPPSGPKKRRNSKTNVPLVEVNAQEIPMTTTKSRATTPKPLKESKARPPSPSPPPAAGRPQRSARRRTSRETLSPITTTAGLPPLLKQCQRILTQVMAHQHAWPFNQPVDPVSLNIPDYFDVIKRPMDLRTIKERLEEGHYATINEFGADVRLVWKNAMTYNPPGSDVYIMADLVSQSFESKFEKLVERQQKDAKEAKEKKEKQERKPPPLPATPPSVISPKDIKQLYEHMKQVEEKISKLTEEKQRPVRRTAPKPKRADENKPMTKEEKRALSLAINDLASEHLGMVVQIIHERMPELAKNAENGEIEIDIDALDTPTLRHLENYVKECSGAPPTVNNIVNNVAGNSGNSNKKRRKPAVPVQNKLQQAAEETETGTAKRIEEVQKKLQEIQSASQKLTKSRSGVGGKTTTTTMAKRPEEEDLVIDDDVPRSYPPVVIEKDKHSDSESSSDSDSDSSSDSDSDSDSDTDSDSSDSSDTESESEKKGVKSESNNNVITPAPAATTTTKTTAPAATTTTSKPPTLNPLSPAPQKPVATSTPVVQDSSKKIESSIGSPPASIRSPLPVPVSTVAPAAPVVPKEVVLQNVEAWANLDEDDDEDGKSVSHQNTLWSEFKSKDELLKQKEREREEQEERLKREREALEEEKRREEEQKKREEEEAAAEQRRKEEEAEAQARKERDQKRLQAKLEREKRASKVVTSINEQSEIMASFEHQVNASTNILEILARAGDDGTHNAPSSDT